MNLSFPEQFVLFCKENIKITDSNIQYQSLPICIIDCVYSLRTKYNSVTIPIVHRYAKKFLGADISNSDDTISNFIDHLNAVGLSHFADKIVCNHQVLGGKAKIPKENVCLKIATYLKCLNIETLDDFRNYAYPELLEIVLRGVKGLGDAGVNYLFMLAGDKNRCKPDVHIHRSIKDACGCDVSNIECQLIYTEAVSILKNDYPNLTVRDLDYAVWSHYSS